MIRSMTAFGRAKLEGERKDITVEIKSVNSRFFDCSVKMPRSLMFLEERIKNYVQKNAVSRAKVDVFITVDEHKTESLGIDLDLGYAESYINALRALRDEFGLSDDISVMTVARNQEIFKTRRAECDLEEEWEAIRPVLDLAIADYVGMRTREGERAFSDLSGKIDSIRLMVDEIEGISKEDTVGYRDKLEARIRQILGDLDAPIDEGKLLTECAVFADKIAIDEELVRLRSHFGAFFEIAEAKEPSGRKLDFLMQEMNRETNTIGSKCNNARIARIVVNIKGELEKIREQVQNFE
ncbi:MAG: YicC family protein [Clostridia bacterium]|nr:YicC family protein [Clostridia bacterium]